MKQRLKSISARPEFWIILLFAWISVSAMRSWHTPWSEAAYTEWIRWSAGIGLFLALGRWLTRTRLSARLLVIAGSILVAVGVGSGLVNWHSGLTGPFSDHQLYGSALLILLPISVSVALTARRSRWRWTGQAVAFAGLLCLIMTETRSAWISVIASAIVFAVCWRHRTTDPAARRDSRQVTVSIALGACVALYFVISLGYANRQQPLMERASTLSVLGQDLSWQSRLLAWHGAEQMVRERPIIGFGLGRYSGEQWRFTHVGRPLAAQQHPSLSEEAHDFYLQTAAEIGVPGLLLYLAALTAMVVGCIGHLRRAKGRSVRSRDGFLAATLALIAGITVDSFASPSYQFPEISLVMWAVLGVGLSALNRNEAVEQEEPALPRPLMRLTRLATSGVVTLTLISQFVPLGLLTPVEAYTTTWHYDSATLTETTLTPAPGSTVTFNLIGHFDQGDYDLTHDGSGNQDTTATQFLYKGNSAFGTTPTDNNVLKVSRLDAGKKITVSVIWRINGSNKTAFVTLNVQSGT